MLGGRRAGRAVPRSAAQLTAVLAEVADGLAAGELFVNKPVDRVNEVIQSGLHRHPFPYMVCPSHDAATARTEVGAAIQRCARRRRGACAKTDPRSPLRHCVWQRSSGAQLRIGCRRLRPRGEMVGVVLGVDTGVATRAGRMVRRAKRCAPTSDLCHHLATFLLGHHRRGQRAATVGFVRADPGE